MSDKATETEVISNTFQWYLRILKVIPERFEWFQYHATSERGAFGNVCLNVALCDTGNMYLRPHSSCKRSFVCLGMDC
jgi:hypothetical protein